MAENGEQKNGEDVQPNQTLYINNLNERIKKEELRKALYSMFSQFGTVLDVVALKTLRMRGQAFVVYKDTTTATNAMRQMQSFPFFDKPMRVQYAKGKSDIISKLEGSFTAKNKTAADRKKEDEKKLEEKKARKAAEPKKAEKRKRDEETSVASGTSHVQPKQLPPNNVLFVENLPEQANELMLQMLFQQFPGYKEVRMVAGKPGIAFVEYDNEIESAAAMNGLQHFKITPTNLMSHRPDLMVHGCSDVAVVDISPCNKLDNTNHTTDTMQTTTTSTAAGGITAVPTQDMHRHETAKGAAGGAAAASVIPGVGTVVGGAIGAAVGHHKKKEHETEGTHQYT
ncbi:hypothetical protein PROFUN_10975 [Planoprotostelium fungivorum]|uniref:RRM domain-containing protein n=1 Tax=Planoprotostelium fungivorum TaxID=1890364 RepID=A0A2P6NBW9_9EUKA|nr:hypothetical protein PROFUN_10975 [Planoprotostelium fungivorum]